MTVDCRIRINPDSFIRRKNEMKKEKYEKKLMEKRNEKRI